MAELPPAASLWPSRSSSRRTRNSGLKRAGSSPTTGRRSCSGESQLPLVSFHHPRDLVDLIEDLDLLASGSPEIAETAGRGEDASFEGAHGTVVGLDALVQTALDRDQVGGEGAQALVQALPEIADLAGV